MKLYAMVVVAVLTFLTTRVQAQSPGLYNPRAIYSEARNEFVVVVKDSSNFTNGTPAIVAYDNEGVMVDFDPGAAELYMLPFALRMAAMSPPGVAYATGRKKILVAWLVDDTDDQNDGLWIGLVDAINYDISKVRKIVELTSKSSLISRGVRVVWVEHAARFLVTWTDSGATGGPDNLFGVPVDTSGDFDVNADDSIKKILIKDNTGAASGGGHVVAYNETNENFLVGSIGGSGAAIFGVWSWLGEDLGSSGESVNDEYSLGLAFEPKSKWYLRTRYVSPDMVADIVDEDGNMQHNFAVGPTGGAKTDVVAVNNSEEFFVAFATTAALTEGYKVKLNKAGDGTFSPVVTNIVDLVTAATSNDLAVAYNPECDTKFVVANYLESSFYVLGAKTSDDACVTRLETSQQDLKFELSSSGTDDKSLKITAKLGEISVGDIVVMGKDANSFKIQANTCVGKTLKHNQQCSVDVRFTASAPGAKEAVLQIGSSAAAGTKTVVLDGNYPGLDVNLYTPFDRSSDIRPDAPLIWLAPKNAPESLGYRVTTCLDAAMRSGCQVTTSFIRGK